MTIVGCPCEGSGERRPNLGIKRIRDKGSAEEKHVERKQKQQLLQNTGRRIPVSAEILPVTKGRTEIERDDKP